MINAVFLKDVETNSQQQQTAQRSFKLEPIENAYNQIENNTLNNDVEMSDVINVKTETEYLNVNEDEETEGEETGDEIDMEDDLEKKIEESIASDILLNQPNQSSATWNDNHIPNYGNSRRIDFNQSQPTTSNVNFHENMGRFEEKNKSQPTTSNRVFHENHRQFEEKNKAQPSSVDGIFNESKQQYEKEDKFSDEKHQGDGERKMFKKNYDKQDPDGLEANYLEFAELIEAFKKKEEIRIENEMKEITEKIMQNNEEDDTTELLKRLEKLLEEKTRRVNQTAIEESEKAEKELENKRNEYLAELFNENFDITKWDNLIVKNIKTDSKPSTSTSSSFGGQDYRRFANEKKPNLSYNQFINKTKVEPLIKKSHMRHQVDLLVDGNIKKLHSRGAANNIPIEMVTDIKNQKEVICRAVQKYLRPYLKDDTIEEAAFKTISKKLTDDHFERNCFGKKNDWHSFHFILFIDFLLHFQLHRSRRH